MSPRIGGLKDDLPRGFVDECRLAMRKIRRFCDQIEDLLIGNAIFQTRTCGIGVIPSSVALQYGLSGANLRASGGDWDLRLDEVTPMAYDQVDWTVWTHLGPFRVRIRSASFNNISVTPWLLRGVYLPDVITIRASLYFILGDVDR